MLKLTTVIPILFTLGTILVILPFYLGIGNISAQTYNKVLFFPDINVTNSNNQNASLDQEFMLVSNNGPSPIEVINPDFGLNQPFVKLIEGQKYIVAPLNEDDIKYTNITVKLAQIFFVSPDIKNLTDADPEDSETMTVGAQIDLGHSSAGGASDFIVPSNLPHGNYVLYVYLQYPYGITGVFSNIATVTGYSDNNRPIK